MTEGVMSGGMTVGIAGRQLPPYYIRFGMSSDYIGNEQSCSYSEGHVHTPAP